MNRMFQRVCKTLDGFLFESCDPRVASLLRVAYASLLIVLIFIWMLDANHWFSQTGVLSIEAAQKLTKVPQWSVFFLSSSPWLVHVGLWMLFLQSLLLLIGFYSRFQAACIFFWLTSFQHRNPLICDGEDTLFRLMAFFFIFLPLDSIWSLTNVLRGKDLTDEGRRSLIAPEKAWGLRWIQIEMTLIYLSAGWSKLQGNTWRDGSAMYYVWRMDDYAGRNWLPSALMEEAWFIRAATWTALAIELFLPFGLWCRPTRRLAIGLGIGLHLMIESTMNLFLFEWIMIVGLLSFLTPSGNVAPRAPLAPIVRQ